jgi:hypothetical protein
MYTGTTDHGTAPVMANAVVTTGLMCPPELCAMLAPANTPKPQPMTMINQSPPMPLASEPLSMTVAMVPLPITTSTAVPRNSEIMMPELDTATTFLKSA